MQDANICKYLLEERCRLRYHHIDARELLEHSQCTPDKNSNAVIARLW